MRVERFVEIDAPVEQVFDAFGDFENVPRWMRNVRDVRRTGRYTSRWTANTRSSEPFEWDVETTVYQPDRRIVWRAVGGDVDTDGEVVLQETPHGTTLMRLVISYYPTGGRHGPAVARFFGNNAEQQLEEDLERFKHDLERRAGVRRRRRRDDATGNERVMRRTRRIEEEDVRRDSRLRDESAPHARRAHGERNSRFDEALREARRSQLENMHRYDEERERARRRRDAEDNRLRESAGADARTRRHLREDEAARHAADTERPPRYALTPREREMAARRNERERHDDDTSSKMLRRGVDRLLDDAPPSSRWRRRD